MVLPSLALKKTPARSSMFSLSSFDYWPEPDLVKDSKPLGTADLTIWVWSAAKGKKKTIKPKATEEL